MASNLYTNKVVYGNTTLIDISDTTATASDVASGKTFYLASGQQATGTATGGGSRLPSGYTEVEYIEAVGTAGCSTTHIPGTKTKIECTFQMTSTAGANEAVYGADQFFFFRRSTGEYRAATSVSYCDFSADSANGWHTVTMIPTGAILTRPNNTPQIGTMASGTPTNAIMLFAYGTAFFAKARVSEVKIWEGQILSRHFIPAVRNSDNRAGFYDIVQGLYTSNISFIAGNPV